LARDILSWFRHHRPEIFQRLEYIILEPSAPRQKRQAATLCDFTGKVNWLPRITHHATRFQGIIFANELLDAMPVRRFGWDATKKTWFEWGVTLTDNEITWTRLGSLPPGQEISPPFETNENLLAVLPDGFTFEGCLEGQLWWQDAARALERGKL